MLTPSPVVLTMRPRCCSTLGSVSSRRCAYRAFGRNIAPDPMVDAGNPAHRHETRTTPHPTCLRHRVVTLAPRPPRRSATRTSQNSQKENATVMLSIIPDNPRIGRMTLRDGVRELVEPKYGFLIPYVVKERKVFILRVYRSTRRPLDYDSLNLP